MESTRQLRTLIALMEESYGSEVTPEVRKYFSRYLNTNQTLMGTEPIVTDVSIKSAITANIIKVLNNVYKDNPKAFTLDINKIIENAKKDPFDVLSEMKAISANIQDDTQSVDFNLIQYELEVVPSLVLAAIPINKINFYIVSKLIEESV